MNYKEVSDFKRMIREIRELGRNNILEHITALKNNDQMPNDILSIALKNYSKNKKLHCLKMLTSKTIY